MPRWERVGCFLEKWRFKPGRSVLRHAWDHGLLVFVAYVLMILLVFPVSQSEVGIKFCVLFVAAVSAAFSFLFFLLLLASSNGDSGRTVRKVALYSLASLPHPSAGVLFRHRLALPPGCSDWREANRTWNKVLYRVPTSCRRCRFLVRVFPLAGSNGFSIERGGFRPDRAEGRICSLASLPVLPAATFVLYWGLSIDPSTSLFTLRFACCMAPAFTGVLIVMARLLAKERRYEEEWASLEIGA